MASGVNSFFNGVRDFLLSPEEKEQREHIKIALRIVRMVAVVLEVASFVSFVQAPGLVAALTCYSFYELAMVSHNILFIFENALTEFAASLSRDEYLEIATKYAPLTRFIIEAFHLL